MMTETARPQAPPAMTDGVLNVYKDAGWTSHDVVAKLRTLLGHQRIGHAGTLDPSATGVLPVLLGKATRIAEYLVSWEKEYRAVMRLGETTDTQDATGTVLATRSTENLDPARIAAVVRGFSGRQRQVPPMYSAIKVRGAPLYKAARAGRSVEREAREITVHEIEIEKIEGRDVTLRILCSKGTYVRTLCADIGEALGVGAHLWRLERLRVGPLSVHDALSVDEIMHEQTQGTLSEKILPLDRALAAMPAVVLDDAAADRVLHGVPVPMRAIRWEGSPDTTGRLAGQTVRLKNRQGRLLGLGAVPSRSSTEGGPGAPVEPVLPIVKMLAG